MSTRATLIPGLAANAPDGRRDIARGFKLARRWQQQGKWREAEQVYGDWEDGCLVFERTKRPVTSASSIEVRRPIYRPAVGRWRRYANELGPLLEALEIPAADVGAPSMAMDHA